MYFQPNAIVHCAAERSPDKVENEYEASRKLNVECSENLARFACKYLCNIFFYKKSSIHNEMLNNEFNFNIG